jgi:hypothetical protein
MRANEKPVQHALKRVDGGMHFHFSGTCSGACPGACKQKKIGAAVAAIVSQKQGGREIHRASTSIAQLRLGIANSSTKLFFCRFVQ